MTESEKLLDRKLAQHVKKMGGWSVKLETTHINGLPDRLCLLPGGRAIFVEVKTTDKKPRKIQSIIHNKLRRIGFQVFVLDDTTGLQNIK